MTDSGPLADMARARGASAAATAGQIAFPDGVPRTETLRGRFQIGHELGHVARARGGNALASSAEGHADAAGRALAGLSGATGAPKTGHPGPDTLDGEAVHYGIFDPILDFIDDPFGYSQRLNPALTVANMRILAAMPDRTLRLIEEFIETGLAVDAWLQQAIHLLMTSQSVDDLIAHALQGAWQGKYMAGELLGAIADVVGVNEIAHALFVTSGALDPLDPSEIDASRHVHPPGLIPYSDIRVDRDGIVARLAALSDGSLSVVNQIFGTTGVQHRSVTTMHVIHTGAGVMTPGLAVHELTHVGQFTMTGSRYMAQALHAQLEGQGYDYRRRDGSLSASIAAGRGFLDFNREQQAQICEDYYDARFSGASHFGAPLPDLEHFVRDLWRVRGATWPAGGP